MKGLLALIVSLFVAAGLVACSMAHAAEMGGGRSAVASLNGCLDVPSEAKDGLDQGKSSSTEDGKSQVKFHACHCHHIGVPVEPAVDKPGLFMSPLHWGVPGLMCRWPRDPGARFRRRFSPQQNRWLFEVDGRWLGLCAAQPRWLCRRWPETGGDGFEHAGVGAC